MVEQRLEGESELTGMALFSRWFYGPLITSPTTDTLTGTYQVPRYLYGAADTGLYVGLGNSVVIQVNLALPAPVDDTDVVAVDVFLAYRAIVGSFSDSRAANTGSTSWSSSLFGVSTNDFVSAPHPFWLNTNIVTVKRRVWRCWSSVAEGNPVNPPSAVGLSDFIIRDIAADDNLTVMAYLVPRSCTVNTSPWKIQQSPFLNAYHIQCRLCYGGNARSQ